MVTKEETEFHENAQARLNAETARLSWPELERHFARGAVIRIDSELDLIDVAIAIADDEKAAIETWMNAGQVGHPDMENAKDWVERQPDFWTVVIAPWVLIQEVKTSNNDEIGE